MMMYKSVKHKIKHKILYRLKMIHIEFKYHKRIFLSKIISKKQKRNHFFSMITRRCVNKGLQCSGGYAYLKHSNCAYVDELSNYNYCCSECHKDIDDMYQDWWDEYNSSRY